MRRGGRGNFEVRRRSFCLLVASSASTDEPRPVLVIRASDDEREMLLAMGDPFFEIPKNRWKVGFASPRKPTGTRSAS